MALPPLQDGGGSAANLPPFQILAWAAIFKGNKRLRHDCKTNKLTARPEEGYGKSDES